MKLSTSLLTLPLLVYSVADAFPASKLNQHQQTRLAQAANENDEAMSRRSLLSGAAAASFLALAPNTAMAQDEIPITPFNGLIFNYRGSDDENSAFLHADDLDEPSVPFKEFAERMQKGEVKFVEFLAPSGDAAYVTFKDKEGKIRIGEGYPIEKHDGTCVASK